MPRDCFGDMWSVRTLDGEVVCEAAVPVAAIGCA
jgi:hypothetical protein